MLPSVPAQQDSEAILGDLIEEFTNRVQAGESADVESYVRQHPAYADRLRQLLPALALLGDLGRSSSADGDAREGPLVGMLGDYRLLRPVGKGGMGIVYEAEQISLRRRVALKVLPLAATLDPRQLQRFHNEAQAAACLHHTNIVPVFSVGCDRGIHFYAMQFIDGQPLSDLIRQLGQREQTTPPPAAALTPRSGEERRSRGYFRKVAELGVQAAEALDHAHQLGIVHRDIKPGNLMLDGRGNLWVTDFGLAYVQRSEANLTATGQAVGTPRYMSPEQALAQRAPLDHRTDVYSLGVTLYELLTLRPAFASEDRQELLRQIADEEPARPRRLERAIPAELEIIVLKAMEKRPQDRYGTAQELADDLRRWLLDQPIRARRPSIMQRAAKWGRRHRPLVVAAALSLCLALVLLAISNVAIWYEHEQTREALHKANLHQKEVEYMVADMVAFRTESESKLLHSLERMDRLLTALEEPFPEEGTEAARISRAVCKQAISFYQDVLPIKTANPSLRWEVMWAYVRLGNLHALQDQFAEAQQAYLWAGFNARKCLESFYRGDTSGEQANAVLSRQSLRLPAEEFPERPAIEKAYRRALAHWRKIAPKELGGVPAYRVAVQEVLGKQETFSERLHLWERVVEDLPTLNNVQHLLSLYPNARNVVGVRVSLEEKKVISQRILKQIEKAIDDPVFSASLSAETFSFTAHDEIVPESVPWFTRTELLAGGLLQFGHDLDELGMPPDAATAFRASLHCYEELLRQQPDTDPRTCYFGLAEGHRNLGSLQREARGRRAEYATAARFYSRALAMTQPEGVKERLHLTRCRYRAACTAVVIGCGEGEDAVRLRGLALDWLRADLEAWQKMLREGGVFRSPPPVAASPSERGNVQRVRAELAEEMQHWLQDDELAGVRDAAALAPLPQAERLAWQKFWQEVEALQQRTASPPPSTNTLRP